MTVPPTPDPADKDAMSSPRDRLRPRRNPLEAAVALEVAAGAMRSALRNPEPADDLPGAIARTAHLVPPSADEVRVSIDPAVVAHLERWDTAAAGNHDPGTGGDGFRDSNGFELLPPAPEEGYPPGAVDLPFAPEPESLSRFAAGGQTPDMAPAVAPPVFSFEHPAGETAGEPAGPVAAWRSRHDPRSLAFPAQRLLRGSGPLQDVLLPTGPVLDQTLAGPTVADQACCTGAAIVAALNSLGSVAPYPGRALELNDAERIYDRARRVDNVPGDDTVGTSVLGALTATVQEGLAGGYLWCFGTKPIAQTIIQRRLPVVVGVRWPSGMWETGPGGLVEVRGEETGLGHALAIVGIRLKGPQGQTGPYFVWQNSIGTGYGDGGFGYIHHRDLSALLRGVGEAAVLTLEPQAP